MRIFEPTRRKAIALMSVAAAGALGLAPAGASAQPVVKIGPHQYFVGSTHGQLGTDKVLMICPGGATSGHPAGGQTVEVSLAPAGSTTEGYTGSKAHEIVVTFPGPSTAGDIVLYAYGVRAPIPTSLILPCGTTAIVRFTPVPTSKTARADLVPVAFDPGPAVG